MGHKKSSSKSTTTVQPWQPAQQDLKNVLAAAKEEYDKQGGLNAQWINRNFPDLSPEMQKALQDLSDSGQLKNVANQMNAIVQQNTGAVQGFMNQNQAAVQGITGQNQSAIQGIMNQNQGAVQKLISENQSKVENLRGKNEQELQALMQQNQGAVQGIVNKAGESTDANVRALQDLIKGNVQGTAAEQSQYQGYAKNVAQAGQDISASEQALQRLLGEKYEGQAITADQLNKFASDVYDSDLVRAQKAQEAQEISEQYAAGVQGLNQQVAATGNMGSSRAGVAQAGIFNKLAQTQAKANVDFDTAARSQAYTLASGTLQANQANALAAWQSSHNSQLGAAQALGSLGTTLNQQGVSILGAQSQLRQNSEQFQANQVQQQQAFNQQQAALGLTGQQNIANYNMQGQQNTANYNLQSQRDIANYNLTGQQNIAALNMQGQQNIYNANMAGQQQIANYNMQGQQNIASLAMQNQQNQANLAQNIYQNQYNAAAVRQNQLVQQAQNDWFNAQGQQQAGWNNLARYQAIASAVGGMGGTTTQTQSGGGGGLFNTILGGAATIGGGVMSMMGNSSDVTLKGSIKRTGRTADGTATYDWRWKKNKKGAKGKASGVLAQQEAGKKPDAVFKGQDGLLAVDYKKLPVKVKNSPKVQNNFAK